MHGIRRRPAGTILGSALVGLGLIMCGMCAEAGGGVPYVLPVFEEPPAAEAWAKAEFPRAVQRTVARDEWVNISFAFLPTADAADVRVRPLVLRKDGKMWETAADLRIVHTWPQIDLRTHKITMRQMKEPFEQYFHPIPELLLKDDTVEFEERWDGNRYVPPSMPKEFHTTLTKGKVKWLWLSLRVPKDLAPGRYEGNLEVAAGDRAAVTLPIALNVLAAELPDPDKIYGIFLRASRKLDNVHYVDDARYQAQLRAMHELGLNALIVDPFPSLEKFDESLGLMREAGFTGPIVCMESDVKAAAAIMAKHGYGPFFYGVDEPGAKTDKAYREKAKRIQDVGGKVVAAMRSDTSRRYAADGLIDMPILSHCYIPGTAVTREYTGPEKWIPHMQDKTKFAHRLYYFQSWTDLQHTWLRMWYGFYLYRSGFDGVMPYCLMAFQKGLPYHTDARIWNIRRGRAAMKMFCTAYPSKEGPVPTLQWEAYREGITDMRWIRLYEKLDKESGGALTNETLYAALQPFHYRGQRARLTTDLYPIPEAARFDEARGMLIDAIAAHLAGKPIPKVKKPVPGTEPVMDVGNPEQERRSAIEISGFGKPESKGGKTCRNSDETGPGDRKAGWGSIFFRVKDHDVATRITLTVWGESNFGGLLMKNPKTKKWGAVRGLKLSGQPKWEKYTCIVRPFWYKPDTALQAMGFGGGDNQVWISEIRMETLK